eukprot:300374-Rhodomonas_salina.1
MCIRDRCWQCPPGTYALQPAVYPHTMSAPAVTEALALCRACDQRATCRGGADVQADEGYWRGADEEGEARIYRCFPGRCKGGAGIGQCEGGKMGP